MSILSLSRAKLTFKSISIVLDRRSGLTESQYQRFNLVPQPTNFLVKVTKNSLFEFHLTFNRMLQRNSLIPKISLYIDRQVDAVVLGALKSDIRMKCLLKLNLLTWYFQRVAIISRQIVFIDIKLGYQFPYGINITKNDI